MGTRKAIYTPFPQAVPRMPVIDTANCTWFTRGKCQVCSKVCPTDAIDYDQKDEIVELEVGNIIMATGWKLFDCKRIPQYGYGRLANVYTNMEFERLCNAAGPTNGKIVLRDGKTEPQVGGHHPLRRQPRREDQPLLLGRLLHGGVEVRPPRAGEDQGRGLLVLHRHADAA